MFVSISSKFLSAVNLRAVVELYRHIKTFNGHSQIQKFRAIKHSAPLSTSNAVCIYCSCRGIYAGVYEM